jgi:hypothetical protein
MAFDENRPRRRHEERYLTATAYRYATSGGFTVWGTLLIIFVYSRSMTAWVGRNDLLQLLQASAALAAVILAILALLEQLGSRDRYLKMALSGLLICFVAATVTSLLSALTNPQETGLQNLEFRLVFVGGLYLSVGLSGTVVVSLERLKAVRLGLSAALNILDYSPTVLPFFAFALWSRRLFFAATAVVLSVGGAVLLLCATIAMFIVVWRSRTREEQLRPQVFEVLSQARERHQNGQTPEPITIEFLRNQTHSNDENLQDVLEELARTDTIARIDYNSYYLLNDSDWSRCSDVVTGTEILELDPGSRDGNWNQIAQDVADMIRLPRQVIDKFMLGSIKETIDRLIKSDLSPIDENYRQYYGSYHYTRALYARVHAIAHRLKDLEIQDTDIEQEFKCLPHSLSSQAKQVLVDLHRKLNPNRGRSPGSG